MATNPFAKYVQAQPGSPEYPLINQVATTPEEDAADAQQEAQPWVGNELDKAIAEAKDPKVLATLQEEKKNRDASMVSQGNPFDKYAQADTSAENPFAKYTQTDSNPFAKYVAPQQTKLQKTTSGAMSAVDFLAGVPGMVASGLAGVGAMATGNNPAEWMDKTSKVFQVSHWLEQAGVPKEYLENQQAQNTLNTIVNYLPEHAGQYVYDLGDKFGLSNSTKVALATQVHTLVGAAELGLPVHSMLKGGKLNAMDIRQAREKLGYTPNIDETTTPKINPEGADVTEGVNLPPDASMPGSDLAGSQLPEGSLSDMPWQVDENGVPYKQDLSQLAQGDMFQQTAPTDRSPTGPLPPTDLEQPLAPDDLRGSYRRIPVKDRETVIQKTETPPNTLPGDWPVNVDPQGNLSSPSWYVDNIERQGQLKLQEDQGPDSAQYYPNNPTTAQDAHNANQVDQAWAQFNAEKDAQQKVEAAGEKAMQTYGARKPAPRYASKQRGGPYVPPDVEKSGEPTAPVAGLAARLNFLRQRVNELANSILAPDTSVATRDAAREEMRKTQLYLKETMDKIDTLKSPARRSQAGALDPSVFLEGLFKRAEKFSKYTDRLGEVIPKNAPYLRNQDSTPKVLWHGTEAVFHKDDLRPMNDIGIHFAEGPVAPYIRRYGDTEVRDAAQGRRTVQSLADTHASEERAPNRMIPKLLKTTEDRVLRNFPDVGSWNNVKTVSTALAKAGKIPAEDALRWSDEYTASLFDPNQKTADLNRIRDDFRRYLVNKGIDAIHYKNTFEKIPGQPDTNSWVVFAHDKLGNPDDAQRFYAKTGAKMGGYGNKQSGMINFGALFGKKSSENMTFGDEYVHGLNKDNVNDIIARALTTSESFESFQKKLDFFSKDAAWQNSFVANAMSIWKDKENFMDNYKGSVFSKLSPTEQKMTADLRSGPTFFKEEQPKMLSSKDDLNPQFRFAAPTSVLRKITNPQARKFINWTVSNVQEIVNAAQHAYRDMMMHTANFSKLTRKEQIGMRQANIKFDGTQNNTLRDLGLQWPTADMLRKEGLNDYQIEAYQNETKGLDMGYDLVAQVFRDQGLEPPPRVPGYFPHTWLGSYRLLIADENGLHTIRPYATKWGRDLAYRAARKELGPDAVLETQDPVSHVEDKNIADALLQAVQVFNNKDKLGQAIIKKLERMDVGATRGIIQEALERQGMKGYEAEKGMSMGPFGDMPFTPGRAHNDRMIVAYQRYMEHVSRFYANSRIATEVKAPLNDNAHLFMHTKQLRGYLDDFISNATGNSVNHDVMPSVWLRQIAITMGLPPNAVINTLTGLGKYMVTVRLRVPNPRFMSANILQPITQAADLMQVHSDRVLAQEKGENVKLGNPVRAMGTMLQAWTKAKRENTWEPWARSALQYAKDRGFLDVFLADHLDPIRNTDIVGKTTKMILDQPNNIIEQHGRMSTYLAHVAYNLDAGMTTREAYEAAGNQVDLAMGNYNPMHQPTMYRNLGVGGWLLRPFALLRNTYLGKLAMALQTLGQAAKTSPRAFAYASGNLGSYLGGWIVFSGLTGAIGANEADALIKWYNSLNPDKPLPRMGVIMRKVGAPNWMIYGLLSSWGPNAPQLGPSMAAPALTEANGIPGIEAGKNVAVAAYQASQYLTNTGPNAEKLYAAARGLAPNLAQPLIEQMIAAHQGGVTPSATKLNGEYRRTPMDYAVVQATGAKTLREQSARDANSLMHGQEETDRTWKQDQVSNIVNSMLGITDSKYTSRLIQNAMTAGKGFDSDSLKQAIKEELDKRVTDNNTRQLQEIQNAKSLAEKGYKAKLYTDLRGNQ